MPLLSRLLSLLLPALLLSAGCLPVRDMKFRTHYHEALDLVYADAGEEEAVFLKAHLSGGDVVVFGQDWVVDLPGGFLEGQGQYFDFNRRLVHRGQLRIELDSVELFETNRIPETNHSSRMAALTVLGGLNTALGVYCLAVPKACFGSCPTFYTDGDRDVYRADAEGFSNAIAPGLEYTDIDALPAAGGSTGVFQLTMKNEAYETHNVRSVKLLSAPRGPNQRVYHDPTGHFYLAQGKGLLQMATADEGDIAYLLRSNNGMERFSPSDPDNIRSRESIQLVFDRPEGAGQLGLVAGFRQSLMTTYLLYDAFDRMGNVYSDFLAGASAMDQSGQSIGNALHEQLGGIGVYLLDPRSEEWVFQGEWYETGPIALNHQILLLDTGNAAQEVRVRLELNRGLWRLDYFYLTGVVQEVEPVEILPHKLYAGERENARLLGVLNNPDQHLVSQPGDEYRFEFVLPPVDEEMELFLSSTGYYLVWGRDTWQQESDLRGLWRMRHLPRSYLRKQAKDYKEYEAVMEEAFWNSRVDHQIISNHEE